VPGVAAAFCPQPGVWFHAGAGLDRVEMLACESAEACPGVLPPDANATCGKAFRGVGWTTAWQREGSDAGEGSGPNQCGDGYAGFMCSECAEGWNKVDGLCIPCAGFNPPMLATYVLSSWGLAFILLHKSIKDTISREDIEDIWYKVMPSSSHLISSSLLISSLLNWCKVDVERTGRLGVAGVGQVLKLTGIFPRQPVPSRGLGPRAPRPRCGQHPLDIQSCGYVTGGDGIP
jgi:hypothetical protein